MCADAHTALGHLLRLLREPQGSRENVQSHERAHVCSHKKEAPLLGQRRERHPLRPAGPSPLGSGFPLWLFLDPQLQATGPGARAAQPRTTSQPRWAEEAERNVLGSE